MDNLSDAQLTGKTKALGDLIEQADKAGMLQKVGYAMSAVRVAYQILVELVKREVAKNGNGQ